MKWLAPVFPYLAIALLMSTTLFAPLVTTAQEASPAAGECLAPELPPGTPTPMEGGTPTAMDEMEDMEEMASPEAEGEMGMAPEAPAGTPIAGAEAEAATAGLENLIACLNSGNYLAVAALMTDNFVQNFIGVPTRYDVPATFEDPEGPAQPIETRSLGEVRTYDDGQVSVDWVYAGLFTGPGALTSERWYLVEEDGFYLLDNIMSIPVPEGVVPDATIVEVQMVDYAFALSTYTIPSGPVIFRTTNMSGTGAPHVNVILTYAEGTTAAGLISGEADIDAATGFYGAVFLEPGQSGDVVFENLEPGTYFLGCDVETADGTPHYELGMVAQITVE